MHTASIATLRTSLAAVTILCAVASTVPAFADHGDRRGPHDEHWDGHRDHWHHAWGYDGGYYPPPPVVYSRPYYAPPPVVFTPGFGLNIHIR